MREKDVPRETLHDCGLDWLTLTVKGHKSDADELLTVFDGLHKRAIEYGEKEKTQCWNTFGGVASDHLFFGRNAWGVMLRASSGSARDAAREIAARDIRANCTRLDAQVTVRTPGSVRDYIAECLGDVECACGGAEAFPNRELSSTKKPDGSSGFRVGAANSCRRGVVYDKTAEQRYRVESRLARFEARFGGRQANTLWDELTRCPDHNKRALDLSAAYFRTVGLERPWMDAAEALTLPSTYKRVDSERRLDYFYGVVRTMADKLRAEGFGYELDEWWRCVRWGELPDVPFDQMRRILDDEAR